MSTQHSINVMKERIVADMGVIAEHIDRVGRVRTELGGDADKTHREAECMASVETFVAIALRVMEGTNPSKIKAAMVAVEVQARMDGKRVYE